MACRSSERMGCCWHKREVLKADGQACDCDGRDDVVNADVEFRFNAQYIAERIYIVGVGTLLCTSISQVLIPS